MGTISYKLSSKLNNLGESQIFIDILADRTTHYRLKSGVWITPENFHRLIKSNRILSLEWFSRFDELISKVLPCGKEEAQRIMEQSKGTSEDILTLYDEFVSQRMIEKGLSSGTKELYHSVRKLLVEYLNGRPTSTKMIDHMFLNSFITMMIEKGLANVTQNNYFSVLKVFLGELNKKGLIEHNVMSYKPKFKTAENDVIYLTHNELYRLIMLDLTDTEKIVRDIFCVQCMTGLRYSDMINIRKENIKEDVNGKYISLLTKKTTQRIQIYLNNTACEILEKYDWTLPHYTRTTINKILPKICKKAHIDEDIENISFVGNEMKVGRYKKWECITSHSARKTFISMCIEKGINTSVIRSITGHKQLSSFERYVGIGNKTKSDVVGKLEI